MQSRCLLFLTLFISGCATNGLSTEQVKTAQFALRAPTQVHVSTPFRLYADFDNACRLKTNPSFKVDGEGFQRIAVLLSVGPADELCPASVIARRVDIELSLDQVGKYDFFYINAGQMRKKTIEVIAKEASLAPWSPPELTDDLADPQ